MRRTRFEASLDKRRAVDSADAAGDVCDSMDVRKSLMDRVKKGEITLLCTRWLYERRVI